MSKTLRRAPAPLALMAVIFFLSAQSDPGPEVGWVGATAAHFTEYAALAALCAWALAPLLGRRAIAAAATIALLYGISDELHQATVPDRDADPLDVLVDGLGIAVALALLAGPLAPLAGLAPTRRTARRDRESPA